MSNTLSPADVTALCAAGKAAWDALPARRSEAPFEWRGKKYIARHTAIQLLITTEAGKPVAARYD